MVTIYFTMIFVSGKSWNGFNSDTARYDKTQHIIFASTLHCHENHDGGNFPKAKFKVKSPIFNCGTFIVTLLNSLKY